MKNNSIYNHPIELGTRVSFLLNYFNEKKIDLDKLVYLDFILVYAKEYNGPLNIHPVLPNHIAEIAHKKEIFPDALKLFIKKGLITLEMTEDGFIYKATNYTSQYVSCLKSNYYKKICKNLSWIEANYEDLEKKQFQILFTERPSYDN